MPGSFFIGQFTFLHDFSIIDTVYNESGLKKEQENKA